MQNSDNPANVNPSDDSAIGDDSQKGFLKRVAKLSKNQLMALALTLKKQNVALSAAHNNQPAADHEKLSVGKASAVHREPIAIVGIGCRFPGGVVDEHSYWDLLENGRSGIGAMAGRRWDMAPFFDPDPQAGGKIHTQALGLLDQVDRFDADFFSITPREAESMDPQQRLLLEVVWEAIENSGHAGEEFYGKSVGVFVGMMNKDYLHLNLPDIIGPTAKHSPYYASGEAFSIAAGRLSYILGLHGPTMTIDTACSSSLVCVHLACQSLYNNECEAAIAGGSSLILSPEASIVSSNARMLSPSGQCWTFDQRADGYVRSEGCAVVMLKKLARAVKDRDPIIATLNATAVNHDGRSQGLTAPNTKAQIALMKSALKQSGVAPAAVRYIEAHGTGTPLGDPIEMNSIQSVYGAAHDAHNPLLVGSVKTNIGHAEASAGISGLIKLALSIAKGKIAPHLNFSALNSHIDLQGRIKIPDQPTPWEPEHNPEQRYGAVNSFGFSGTNAHAIVQGFEYNREAENAGSGSGPAPRILTLSAKSETALREMLNRYEDFIAQNRQLNIDDLCYTSNVGRSHFQDRYAITADSIEDLRQKLQAISIGAEEKTLPENCFRGRPASDKEALAIVFGAAEDQSENSVQTLCQHLPVFKKQLQHCRALYQSRADQPLPNALLPLASGYAAFQALMDIGIKPAVVTGVGLTGEVLAACAAGAMDFAAALTIITSLQAKRAETIAGLSFGKPKLRIVAADTGKALNTECQAGDYWINRCNHLSESATVAAGPWLQTMAATVVEIGDLPAQQESDSQPVLAAIPLIKSEQPWQGWQNALARLYVRGLAINWSKVHAAQPAYRIKLPTYPFQRKRYWPTNLKVDSLRMRENVSTPLWQRYLYELEWIQAEPPRANDAIDKPGRTVILQEAFGADKGDLSGYTDVEIVCLDADWQSLSAIEKVLESLQLSAASGPVRLALWVAPASDTSALDAAAVLDTTAVAERSYRLATGLLFLVQVILRDYYSCDIALTVVTESAAYQPEPGAQLNAADAADAAVHGLIRVLTMEQPQLRPGTLDLQSSQTAHQKLAQIIATLAATDGETDILYRHSQRFAQRLKTLPPAEETPLPYRVRPGSAWLISGGLGGIGLALARWLADAGAEEILLLSRRSVADNAAEQLVEKLRKGGATIHLVSADVADYQQLAVAVDRALERPLAGIIHAAGALRDAPIQNLSAEHFTRVMASKVTGTLNLHRLSLQHAIEQFVLFSSIAAVIGSAGQANYASANAFVSGLGAMRTAKGLPATVIHWGPWAQVGMASDARLKQKLDQSGLVLLEPEAALQALGQVMSQSKPQAVIADFAWDKVKLYLGDTIALPLASAFIGAASGEAKEKNVSVIDELLQLEESAAAHRLRDTVIAIVRRVLALGAEATLPAGRSLIDMGMDSLLSVELRNRFAHTFGLSLPVSLLFDYPTVESLAEFLSAEFKQHHGQLAAENSVEPAYSHPQLPSGSAGEAIAIIGASCRMPGGVNNPEDFWQMLAAGVDAVTEFDASRWDASRFYAPGSSDDGKMYCNRAGQIAGVHHFDNAFFDISDREAEHMDPQQRLVLELAWEAVESAAYKPADLAAAAGIFIGPGPSDFADLTQRHMKALTGLMGPGHHISVVAGRIAYALNWQGPCMAIDTACSSSLVAVHMAAQSLREGECGVALAGGVNVILSPANNIVLSKAGMLSPVGKCKTFDAAADGYVRSDGSGLVLLKRLSEAAQNGDNILGVIKGSALNQDGHSQGLTAPNGRQQARLIETALARAGLPAGAIAYVEAHGTGTALGDPIEMNTLLQTYGRHREADNPLYVGSVKTNIGHTESAAGVAGLIKVLLMLRHRRIPPHLHLKTLNPHLTIENKPIRIPTELTPMPVNAERPIYCAVSSFGFSGTNAHVIVQAPPIPEAHSGATNNTADHGGVLILSARSDIALLNLCRRYLKFLTVESDRRAQPSAADICYSAIVGRERFAKAMVLRVVDREDMAAKLKAVLASDDLPKSFPAEYVENVEKNNAGISFRFSGQGVMPMIDADIYRRHQSFKTSIDVCDAVLAGHFGISLPAYLEGGCTSELPAEALPVFKFALQLSLARLLTALGMVPRQIEYDGPFWLVAAVMEDTVPLETALRMVESYYADDNQAVTALSGQGITPDTLRAQLVETPAKDGDVPEQRHLLQVDIVATGSEKTNLSLHLLPVNVAIDHAALIEALGQAHVRGQAVNFARYFERFDCRRVALPTYPFEHKDFSRRQRLLQGETSIDEMLAQVKNASGAAHESVAEIEA